VLSICFLGIPNTVQIWYYRQRFIIYKHSKCSKWARYILIVKQKPAGYVLLRLCYLNFVKYLYKLINNKLLPVQFSIFLISDSSKSSKKHIPSLKNTDLRETVASRKMCIKDQRRCTYLYLHNIIIIYTMVKWYGFFQFFVWNWWNVYRRNRKTLSAYVENKITILRAHYAWYGYSFIILFYKVRQTRVGMYSVVFYLDKLSR